MKILIDIPEAELTEDEIEDALRVIESNFSNTILIPDNATNGNEILIKYCLEHSGEEIYTFLKQLFDDSMSYTDSRRFIIEWLEKGNEECG